MGKFNIHFKGITASSSCILIQGFPENEQLSTLRNKLRENFKQSGLFVSIDTRYKIFTAHLTVMRFSLPLTNNQKLLELLDKYRDYDFGIYQLNQIELVFNNWYQQRSITQQLSYMCLD